jgi:hypothetical protein
MAGQRNLPGLGIRGFWNLGSDGWGTEHSEDLRLLSTLVQPVALSRTAGLPGSPVDGNVVIIPNSDVTNPNKIAIRDNGVWVYVTPKNGWSFYILDETKLVSFNGTNWVIPSVSLGSIDGLSDVVITTPVAGAVLTWDGTNWIDALPSVSGSIDGLSDVITPTPNVGDALIWNGSAWVNQPGLSLNEKTASHTLVLSDAGDYIRMTASSPVDLTVPTNASVAFAVGTTIGIKQSGVGQITIVPASGVTITTPETLKLRKAFSGATLIKVAVNTWDLLGDLEALP